MNYDPRYVYLYPASIPQIVAHIQEYLRDNPITSTATITQMIITELSEHPEILNGAEIPITAEDQQSIKDYIDHLPSVDGYTKEQVNALLDEKQDVLTFDRAPTPNSSNPVTSSGISTAITTAIATLSALINLKANLSDVYTKSVIDQLLSGKANVTDVYTKTVVDTLLGNKANAADVYTKTEANQLLEAKANAVNVYTKTETDTLLNDKADETEVTDLKSAFNQLDNAVIKQTTIKHIASGGTAPDGVEMTDAAYIDTNGVRQLSGGYRNSGYVEIEAWATIDLSMYGLSSFCAVAFYDENKAFISGIIPSGSGWQRISGVQTIPNNAKYYIVTLMNADTTGYAICTDAKRISTEQVAELKEYADERFEAIINPVKVMISDISGEGVQNGFIDSTGKFNSSASWITTGYIRTDAIENIIVRANIFSTVPVVSFYDKYKVYVTSASSASTGIQNYNVTVPSGIHYMRFSLYKPDTAQYYSYSILQMKANALAINQLNDGLYGKKLGAIGDSITIGTYSVPGMTYVNQIANAHNMTVDNQAIWGSVFPTGKTQAENPQGSIYSQVANLANDCDMVIISGGINDADYQADTSYWGTVSGGYDATLDTTTFCGAFEGTLKSALDKFKGKPILFVFEHRMTQTYQSEYGQHFENVQYPLMVEMLNKWGVPYVDLFHDMPSIKLIPDYIALYSFDDQGIHPNIAGYRKFYVPRVESGLEAIAR